MNTNHQNIINRNTLVILPFIIDKVYPYDEHKGKAPRKYPVDIFSERARMSPGIEMPRLPELFWDYKDQLKEVTLNASKHKAYYTYDASGERVRKVVDKGSVVEERLYIAGFEIYRKTVSGTLDYERETLKITEGRNTIAQLETKTIENGNTISTPTTNQRFQYSNHLGSACLELDASGNIISYEEYHPFGTTSYRSGSSETEVSQKRYKYVGKERDEETGLYYYGARYYAAWIARFVSVDPLQFDYAHYTPYQYAGNKPVTIIDLDGLEEFKLEFPNENKANTNININYRPKLKKIPDRIIKLEPIRGHVSSNSDSNIDIKMEKRERYIKKIEGNFYDDLILQKDVTDIESSIEHAYSLFERSSNQNTNSKNTPKSKDIKDIGLRLLEDKKYHKNYAYIPFKGESGTEYKQGDLISKEDRVAKYGGDTKPTWCNTFARDLSKELIGKDIFGKIMSANDMYQFMIDHPESFQPIDNINDVWNQVANNLIFLADKGHIAIALPYSGTKTKKDTDGNEFINGMVIQAGKSHGEKTLSLAWKIKDFKNIKAFKYVGD